MAFLHEHGDAVEADFLRYYGLDIQADLGTERVTWRRLKALIGQLPRGSATARSMHGAAADWGPVEHLAAVQADLLAAANWQRAGKKNAPRPKPIPRPGIKPAGERHRGTPRPVREVRRILDRTCRGR